MKTANYSLLLLSIFLIVLVCGCDSADEKITNAATEALAKNDPSICAQKFNQDVYESEKDGCYAKMALLSNKSDTCKLITDHDRYVNCYKGLAVEKMDMNVCSEIENLGDKSTCAALVSAQIANKMLENSAETIESNYDKLFGQGSSCDSLYSGEDKVKNRQECYARAALRYSKAEFCKKISDHIDSDNCLQESGIANSDNNLCKEIVDNSKREQCTSRVITDYAINGKDVSICGKQSTQVGKDECIRQYAKATMTPSACEQISEEWKKEDCKKAVTMKWASDGKLSSSL